MKRNPSSASGTLLTEKTGSNPPLKHSKQKRGKIVAETRDGRTVEITFAQWLLATHLKELGADTDYEYLFCTDQGKKWRFDIADDENAIAFECNGGKWHGGHRRGNAIEDENDKINTAQRYGWKVFQFTNEQILKGQAKEFLAPIYGAELFGRKA